MSYFTEQIEFDYDIEFKEYFDYQEKLKKTKKTIVYFSVSGCFILAFLFTLFFHNIYALLAFSTMSLAWYLLGYHSCDTDWLIQCNLDNYRNAVLAKDKKQNRS